MDRLKAQTQTWKSQAAKNAPEVANLFLQDHAVDR